ncbi:hypothetical protein PN36_18840 [Candidatus Thiomargarita nelsonii]|uniref:Uncharacterized protein n=1 Tax=Candidatus Thiomargarita nelsonii TaxID=1003181 RepID=A0A0A6P2A1_9GAMM|nr:hypothetical protein PN36_18840 [Candidatus Thiomargarita nelsonii]
MIHQFVHQFGEARYWVDEKEGRRAVLGKKVEDDGQGLDYQRYRLGFRDVARNTDERTMIATVLPPKIFTGNTLVTSKFPKNNAQLIAIIGLLNSFVVDALIRQKVTAHCNIFYVYQLPIPRLTEKDSAFNPIVNRAAKLICTTPEFDDLAKQAGLGSHKNGVTHLDERAQIRAELDGMVAHLYGLTYEEFFHPFKMVSIKI